MSTVNDNPHNLRALVTFALDLADSLGVIVQDVTASDFGTVTLYAWDEGAEKVDAVADAHGWTGENRDGASWHTRGHAYTVDGRTVRVFLVGRIVRERVTA